MQTCVPVEKRSKKAQRAAVRANRVLWQGVKRQTTAGKDDVRR